mmetsp:Transcript_8414/g.30386  ORF Transcript_8414/g.30386 Transcript_8414/m.30386 type:complete len:370 (-) Transcript_8414:437-1546(-)
MTLSGTTLLWSMVPRACSAFARWLGCALLHAVKNIVQVTTSGCTLAAAISAKRSSTRPAFPAEANARATVLYVMMFGARPDEAICRNQCKAPGPSCFDAHALITVLKEIEFGAKRARTMRSNQRAAPCASPCPAQPLMAMLKQASSGVIVGDASILSTHSHTTSEALERAAASTTAEYDNRSGRKTATSTPSKTRSAAATSLAFAQAFSTALYATMSGAGACCSRWCIRNCSSQPNANIQCPLLAQASIMQVKEMWSGGTLLRHISCNQAAPRSTWPRRLKLLNTELYEVRSGRNCASSILCSQLSASSLRPESAQLLITELNEISLGDRRAACIRVSHAPAEGASPAFAHASITMLYVTVVSERSGLS